MKQAVLTSMGKHTNKIWLIQRTKDVSSSHIQQKSNVRKQAGIKKTWLEDTAWVMPLTTHVLASLRFYYVWTTSQLCLGVSVSSSRFEALGSSCKLSPDHILLLLAVVS